MAINPTDKATQQRVFEYCNRTVGDWYDSTEYQNFWTRYEKRRDAYYCRNRSDQPAWKSKLHMATFWLGCKAVDAQAKKAYSKEPMIKVNPIGSGLQNPQEMERANVAGADLNYDLRISRFKPNFMDMLWYMELSGTAVAREYFRSSLVEKDVRGTMVERQEITLTQKIHPLNFGHDETKRGFHDSQWATCRYEIPITDLHKMVRNDSYIKENVGHLIESVEKEGGHFTTGYETFYSERGLDGRLRKRHTVVNEWSGPLPIKGNEADPTLYYVLFSKVNGKVLRISKNKIKRHPYWKIQAHPDPDGPFGVGPCDMLLPINAWENSTVNQYVDYMNASLKFMYTVRPDLIQGGSMSLIDGLPLGLIELEKNATSSDLAIAPVRNNMGSIPAVGDVMQLIDKYKEMQGPSSNLRGDSSEQLNDTATGITLMAQREDAMTAAMLEGVDQGLVDGMQLKLRSQMAYFEEERIADVEGEEGMYSVAHYPYELDGVEFAYNVQRATPDAQVAKSMSWLKFLSGLNNLSQQPIVPPNAIVDAAEEVGIALDMPGASDIFRTIRSQMGNGIPQVQGGVQGAGGPEQGQLPTTPPAAPGQTGNIQAALA